MAKRGREADCDVTVPPVPEAPGTGPLPKYARGGKTKHIADDGSRGRRRLDRRSKGGRTKDFHPGGEKGKLHRELGIPEDEKIPKDRLASAVNSENPEIRRDAIRARTMEKWHKK